MTSYLPLEIFLAKPTYDPDAVTSRYQAELVRLEQLPKREQRQLRRRWRAGLAEIALATTMGLALTQAVPGFAAGITVDGSTCTLADAIRAANTDDASVAGSCVVSGTLGADTITLADDITLTAELPAITSTITISGNHHAITWAGVAGPSILRVESPGALTLRRATISGAAAPEGGGIYNAGHLTVTESLITGNYAAGLGGGILTIGPSMLTVQDSTVTGNTAALGAGLAAYDHGTALVQRSIISGNLAVYGGGGGASAVVSSTLTLRDSTISGNGAINGGGLYATDYSTVTVENNSTIRDNYAYYAGGGASAFVSSTLTLRDSTISGNGAMIGGGLYAGYYSMITVENNSTIRDNYAYYVGGGIAALYGSALTARDSAITGNTAGGSGGGLDIYGYSTAVVDRSTISGNVAASGGGLSAYYAAHARVRNSTLSGNTAMDAGGGVGAYLSSTVTLQGSTITGNTARYGGGLYAGGMSTATLESSIVSGNAAIEGGRGSEVYAATYDGGYGQGAVEADRHNLFGHSGITRTAAFYNFVPGAGDTDATSDGGDTPLTDILDPVLRDNGGDTWTHALPEGSPARDVISTSDALCATGVFTTDQRGEGYVRPEEPGGRCDIGAFEAQAGSTALGLTGLGARVWGAPALIAGGLTAAIAWLGRRVTPRSGQSRRDNATPDGQSTVGQCRDA